MKTADIKAYHMHPYHSTNDAAVKVISHKNNNVKNKSHHKIPICYEILILCLQLTRFIFNSVESLQP